MPSSHALPRWRKLSAVALVLLTPLWLLGDFPVAALWPSIVAILLVVLTQRVLLSLVAGAFCGCLLLTTGNPIQAFSDFWTLHVVRNLQSDWKIGPILFTLILGGFAAVIEKGGGLQTLVRRFVREKGEQSRRVQWSAYALGLVCFFDGLANSMMVGRVFRQLADRFGVSRAMLAYIVDSTSSAVTCVAIISTWIAFQLSQIREGFILAGVEEVNVFGLFLRSIPYNFYCWYTILLVALVILWRVRLGPMSKEKPVDLAEAGTSPPENESAVWRAVIPLVVLILTILGGLYVNHAGWVWPRSMEEIAIAYGEAQSAIVLVYASAFAALVAVLLYPRREHRQEASALKAFEIGAASLFAPVLILIAAWALSSVLGQLGAAPVLTALLEGNLPIVFLPLVIFVTGALISFSTGTSWGTMGILMPLAVPVVLGLTSGEGYETYGQNPYLLAAIGAVFSGAVFGDHCSPLSDTTIVSSLACEVDPYVHVKTQLPFALLAASVAGLTGFLLIGFGLAVWLALPLGVGLLVGVAYWRKTPCDKELA